MINQEIKFSFEDRVYVAPAEFYDTNRAKLPDGRIVEAGGWFETMPPIPGGIQLSSGDGPFVEARIAA
jgi:hypothetical protein